MPAAGADEAGHTTSYSGGYVGPGISPLKKKNLDEGRGITLLVILGGIKHGIMGHILCFEAKEYSLSVARAVLMPREDSSE